MKNPPPAVHESWFGRGGFVGGVLARGASALVNELHHLGRRVDPVDGALLGLGHPECGEELAAGQKEGILRLRRDEGPGVEEARVGQSDVLLHGAARVGTVVAMPDDDPVRRVEAVSRPQEGREEPLGLDGTSVGPLAHTEVVLDFLEPFAGSDEDSADRRHQLLDDRLQAGDLAVAEARVLRVVTTVTIAVSDSVAHGAPFCFRRLLRDLSEG